jgi:Ca2+/H+ antiporter
MDYKTSWRLGALKYKYQASTATKTPSPSTSLLCLSIDHLTLHRTFESIATTIFTKMKYIAAIVTVLRYVLYKYLQNEDFY